MAVRSIGWRLLQMTTFCCSIHHLHLQRFSQNLLAPKTANFPYPLSFNALEPFPIFGFRDHSLRCFDTTLACDRRSDKSTTANTGICIASCSDAPKKPPTVNSSILPRSPMRKIPSLNTRMTDREEQTQTSNRQILMNSARRFEQDQNLKTKSEIKPLTRGVAMIC